MMRQYKPLTGRQFIECGVELAFETRCQGDVSNGSADLTDQVMVMLGEIFGKFVTSVFGGMDQPPNDANILHNRKVAVCRTLRELRRQLDEFGQRHRSVGSRQSRDHRSPTGRVALVVLIEPIANGAMEFRVS